MIEPKSVSEKLLFSTIRIEVDTPNGRSVGSGFFFIFKVDDARNIPVIVTNRHVIANGKRGRFKMHHALDGDLTKPSGQSTTIGLDNFEELWIGHPSASIDLCVMPIVPLLIEGTKRGVQFFYIPLGEDLLMSDSELEQMQAVENILMVVSRTP